MPLPVLGKAGASQSLNEGDSSREGVKDFHQQVFGGCPQLVLRSGDGDLESQNVPREGYQVIYSDEDHAGTALRVGLLDFLVETGNGLSTYGKTNRLWE